ncbi:hypothetical protein ACN9MZ_06785 [Pseudoduganella sp. S-14]|jgi:hypothetical protein|uniref:hypothetical protein n=1 Tax=Pseudoduganella sp. S-14 TaxID=3404065 RepID=UPI003CF33750
MINTRHLCFLATVSLVMLAENAIAQTHCNEAHGEVTHFSCAITGTKKVASLCGGGYGDSESVQYRFGRVGMPEFVYPTSGKESLKKFEGHYFNKYSYVSYLFINNKALYEIELSESYPKVLGVIRVEVDNKRHELQCAKAVSRDYWDSLIELSPRTFHYTGDGKDSFLYQYNNVIKKKKG